jgi:hypothetical protein
VERGLLPLPQRLLWGPCADAACSEPGAPAAASVVWLEALGLGPPKGTVRAQAGAPSAYGLGAVCATVAVLLGCGLSCSRASSALVPLLLLPAALRLLFLSEALLLRGLVREESRSRQPLLQVLAAAACPEVTAGNDLAGLLHGGRGCRQGA